MKLRGKVILIFVLIMIIVLSGLGTALFASETNSITKITQENITSTVAASSHDISDQFAIYEDIIRVIGHDELLYGNSSNQEKAKIISGYAEAFGFTSGNILDSAGVSLSDGTDFSDREYVQKALKGEVSISTVTISKLTGNYGFSIAGPLYNATDSIVGVVYLRMEIVKIVDVLTNMKISDNGTSYIVDNEGNIIIHENPDMIGVSVNEYVDFAAIMSNEETSENGFTSYKIGSESFVCAYSNILYTNGWFLVGSAPASDFNKTTKSLTRILILAEIVAIIFSILGAILLSSAIVRPINRIKESLVKLSEGDFSGNITERKGKDEIAQLTRATASLQQSVRGVTTEANMILGNMSKYDLTSDDMSSYPGEFNLMSESVNQIKEIMNHMIKNVQEAIANVGVGAGEIADATNALSEGTLAQASSIQQVVCDIENVAAQTEKNADNGAIVNEKLQHLDDLIKDSSRDMAELREVVLEIEQMSGDIQKIVSDIDSISFQTNILALNASVEAARAGENGKGFAVVADEVGNLANKSSDSSKKTSELIEKCISSINKAKKCADATFNALNEIVTNSDEIASAFADITSSNEEQTANTLSIKGEVTKISDVVQTNTATAQQTAASTQVLSGEAENLSLLIRKFRV